MLVSERGEDERHHGQKTLSLSLCAADIFPTVKQAKDSLIHDTALNRRYPFFTLSKGNTANAMVRISARPSIEAMLQVAKNSKCLPVVPDVQPDDTDRMEGDMEESSTGAVPPVDVTVTPE